MSALGFFRKNEKAVFWIMVVLMAVFLVGSAGRQVFDRIFSPPDKDFPIGVVNGKDITERQLRMAGLELRTLREVFGLGDPIRLLTGYPRPVWGEEEFYTVLQSDRSARSWLLLGMEAERMGLQAGDIAVNDFLRNEIGIDPKGLMTWVFRQGYEHLTEKDIREMLNRYLIIAQAFRTQGDGLYISDPKLKRMYRDMAQTVNLRMAPFRAADFLDQVNVETSEKDIQDLFQACRQYPRGSARTPNPFRFGYRVPDRVSLAYVFIDLDEVAARIDLDSDVIYQYWEEHKDDFTRPVTIEPTEGEESEPTVEMVRIEQFKDAKPLVRARLTEQEAARAISDAATRLLAEALRLNAEASATAPATDGPLVRAAQEVLADMPYHVVRATDLMSAREMAEDDILGGAQALNGLPLYRIAFSVPELAGAGARTMTKVGDVISQPLAVNGLQRGRLICRVVQADPSHVPTSLTAEIREQVVDDYRTMAAFDLAVQAAEEAVATARADGLDAVAQARDIEILEAPDTPRSIVLSSVDVDPVMAQAMQSALAFATWQAEGMKGEQPRMLAPEAYAMTINSRPFLIGPPPVEGVDPAETQRFLDAAFQGLTTSDEAPTTNDAESAEASDSEAFFAVPLPGQQAAMLVHRLDYRPAYEQEYEQRRQMLLRAMAMMDRHDLRMRWFNPNEIETRVGFVDVAATQGLSDQE